MPTKFNWFNINSEQTKSHPNGLHCFRGDKAAIHLT